MNLFISMIHGARYCTNKLFGDLVNSKPIGLKLGHLNALTDALIHQGKCLLV